MYDKFVTQFYIVKPMRTSIVRSTLIPVAVFASLLTTSPTIAASMYSVSDLGTLPGNQNSIATDINNLGQVVGSAYGMSLTPFYAFIWENGTMTNLGALPNYTASSSASSINDLGQVVGISYDRTPNLRGSTNHAFLWSASDGMTDLGTLGGRSSWANGINNLGQVVGKSIDVQGSLRAYRTAPNSPINPITDDLGINIDNSGFSDANDINSKGQVVGLMPNGVYGGGFVWENNAVTELEGFRSASAINDKGQIVGTPTAGSVSAGVLWDNGVIINLSTLGYGGSANDINDSGQVVGTAYGLGDSRPYIWENGVRSDLNDLIPADSGWNLLFASAINNRGQIVGDGRINGQRRAYLLTPLTKTMPVPEPNYAFAILVLGACSAVRMLRKF